MNNFDKYQGNSDNSDNILETISSSCSTYDPILMFLIGVNYERFKHNYSSNSFKILAEIIQKRIGKKLMNQLEVLKTYENLLEQDNLSSVFDLVWLSRFKDKFEEENEEISLVRRVSDEDHKQLQNKFAVVPPAKGDVSMEEHNFFAQPVIDHKENNQQYRLEKIDVLPEQSCFDVPDEDMEGIHKLQQELDKEEQTRLMKEQEESERFIQQLLQEEKREQENKRKEEELSLKMIQQIELEELKALEERKHKESESSKPECKICYDAIDYQEIYPLSCGHIFHPHCLSPHIRAKVENKNFPIDCPD